MLASRCPGWLLYGPTVVAQQVSEERCGDAVEEKRFVRRVKRLVPAQHPANLGNLQVWFRQ
jgi:hypothetical protein